jgi:hypothetical protein
MTELAEDRLKGNGSDIGRHVFGLGAILFGVFGLLWGQFDNWPSLKTLSKISHPEILIYIASVIEVFGVVAIQWTRTARVGALTLGAIFMVGALLWVPLIVKQPQVFNLWDNLFEQIAMVAGALIVYALADRSDEERSARLERLGYFSFAVCVVAFTIEQIVYLKVTADFVPKWMPPGQMFWAVATTVFFALAAIALLTRRAALPAARCLTAMFVSFGLLVWLPAPFLTPHQLLSWAGNAENDSIAGVAWIVADYLGRKRLTPAA